jgi:hypothetical protein
MTINLWISEIEIQNEKFIPKFELRIEDSNPKI